MSLTGDLELGLSSHAYEGAGGRVRGHNLTRYLSRVPIISLPLGSSCPPHRRASSQAFQPLDVATPVPPHPIANVELTLGDIYTGPSQARLLRFQIRRPRSKQQQQQKRKPALVRFSHG